MSGLLAVFGIHCTTYLCGGGLAGELGKRAAARAASSAATSIFDAFAGWVVDGGSWLVQRSIAFLRTSTSIDIGTGWFAAREAAMTRVALLLLVPLVLAATIGAVVRQDLRRLGRVYGVGIPVALLAGAALIPLVKEAVAVVDALCSLITADQAPYRTFANIDGEMTHHGMPVVVELIVGSVIVLAALALWLELILRSVVIDIAVFFLPLGLAAVVWPATAAITKRFLEMLVAIIGSKFVVVATISLGAALVEQTGAGAVDAVKGTAVLLLASFAPFALFRLIPLLEVAAIAQFEGMSRRPIRAGAELAGTAAGGVKGAAGMLLSRAGGGVEASPVAATDIPSRAGDFALASLGSGDAPASGDPSPGDPGPGDRPGAPRPGGDPGGGQAPAGGPPGGGLSGGGLSGDSPSGRDGLSAGDQSDGRPSAGGPGDSGGPTGSIATGALVPTGGGPGSEPDGGDPADPTSAGAGEAGAVSVLTRTDTEWDGLPDPADLPGPLPVLDRSEREPSWPDPDRD